MQTDPPHAGGGVCVKYTLCILLLSVCVSAAPAQQKHPALQPHTWGAPILVPGPRLPIADIAGGTREGALWSGIGVAAGSLAGFFPALFLGLKFCESYGSSATECSLTAVPFGIGTAIGASLGAETGGDRQAWGTTFAGAAIGIAAAMIAVVQTEYAGLALVVLPPAVGAWIGNRLGQPR